MIIDLGAPAAMVLGAVRFQNETEDRLCLLGAALQHPPINLLAQPHNGLEVSGPRAELGLQQLQRLQSAGLERGLRAEVDLAIPAQMGLGSDAMLGLSLARALAWANGQPPAATAALARGLGLDERHGVFAWGFDQGGLLLVDTVLADGLPALAQRRAVAHDDKLAWALVLVLPHPDDDAPESFEDDALAQLLAAGPHLGPESGRIFNDQLWPAVGDDDLEAFGVALQAIRELNEAALAKVRPRPFAPPGNDAIFELMRAGGAVVHGQIVAGLGLFALVRGAQKTRELRTALQHHIGIFGGTVMATIIDNRGAHHIEKKRTLDESEYEV